MGPKIKMIDTESLVRAASVASRTQSYLKKVVSTCLYSGRPCSTTRRLHCTCTQRCLRHCMLNGVESTRCHQLFCHHGCQLYKMPPWICCHAQATCPSALSLESGTARSRGHRDIERTSRETFCRCRTGLSTILPCRCHPRDRS